MTTRIRRAKEPYLFKCPINNHNYFCRKCGNRFQEGELVIPKACYYGGIPQTVCRTCYVDPKGKPFYSKEFENALRL